MPTMMIPGSVDPDRLFQAFQASPTYSRFASLLARHRVPPKVVIQAVYDEVMFVMDGVPMGYSFTAEALCGEHLWQQWQTDGLHRAMGICLSFLVQTGHLPLVCTTRSTRQTKRYRRINPEADISCLASDNHCTFRRHPSAPSLLPVLPPLFLQPISINPRSSVCPT